jgi:hypothetical protein
MDTAPKDRQILVRRDNDVRYEYAVVHWRGDLDQIYPWLSLDNAYAEGRLDQWHEIPS